MSVLRQSAWAAAAAATLAVSRFAFAAVLARRLTQGAFGQFAYAQWLVDISFLLCSFGAAGATARYMAEYRHDPQVLAELSRQLWRFGFSFQVFAGIGVLCGAWLSGMSLTWLALAMLFLWSTTNAIWAIQTAALSGLQRFDLVFLANAIAAFGLLVGVMLAPIEGDQIESLFALMAATSSSAMLVGLNKTFGLRKAALGAAAIVPWRTIRRYAGNVWLSALVASLVWSRGELPIVRVELGDAALAKYAAALTIVGVATQGIMLGVGGVAAHISRLWGEGRREEAVLLARVVMDLQLLASSCGALIIVFFGGNILIFAFGDAYAAASEPLSIMCLGLVTLSTSCQAQLLQLETDARFNRNVAILGAMALFLLASVLIPAFGLQGGAVARSATMLLLASVTLASAAGIWGRDVAGLSNAGTALLILGMAFGVERWSYPGTAWQSVLFALIGVGAIVMTIRDHRGALVVRTALVGLAQRK